MAISYSKSSSYYFNTKTRKNISVRVDEEKYNKILKHIKEHNKNRYCDMLSFIRCGSFIFESISQYESICKRVEHERWCESVRKISEIIGQK